MVRRLLAIGRLLGALGVLLVGCASPTLPLPPPVAPDLSTPPDADHVKLVATCGDAEAGAAIIIINNSPGVPDDQAVGGARVDGCGAWDATVYAHSGDLLQITQQLGNEDSQTLLFQVP